MKTIAQKLEAVDSSLARWQTRLKRASTMVSKLDKRRRRLQLAAAIPPDAEPIATVTVKVPRASLPERPRGHWDITKPETLAMAARESLEDSREKEDPLAIPLELRRDPNADALKRMNERIEKRAAERSTSKSKKPRAGGILAKAIEENEKRNSK